MTNKKNVTSSTRRWEGHDLVIVPVEIISSVDENGKPLSGTALRLWVALATFTNQNNVCWPSNKTILKLMPENMSRRSIQRAKLELEGADLLRVTHRMTSAGRQTSDLYELRVPIGEGDMEVVGGDDLTAPVGASLDALKGVQSDAPINLFVEPNHNEQGDINDIDKVFQVWCASTERNPNRTKLDLKRRRVIQKALEAYSLNDVFLAVTGWKLSEFHRGHNDRNKKYNDLDLLLRDAKHIEQFRDMHSQSTAESAPSWSAITEIMEE